MADMKHTSTGFERASRDRRHADSPREGRRNESHDSHDSHSDSGRGGRDR